MATEINLSEELMEEIFTQLPLQSLGRASCVCKQWRSLTTSPAFLALHSQKHDQQCWLYINGIKYKVVTGAPVQNSSDSFSEDQLQFHCESSPPPGCGRSRPALWGPGGICYGITGSSNYSSEGSSSDSKRIVYKTGVLEKEWVETPELKHKRTVPIVAILRNYQATSTHQVICIGGQPCNNEGMKSADQHTSSLKVEIYSPETGMWEDCEDLPEEFNGFSTVRAVTIALREQKLYVFHIHSGMVASFDTGTKRWSKVKTLRPPGEGGQFGYLAVENGELLLIGVTYEDDRFSFKAWRVDETSMECIGTPQSVNFHFARPTYSKPKTPKKKSEVITITTSTTTRIINNDELILYKKDLHHSVDNNNCDRGHLDIQIASIWPLLLHLEANFFAAGSRLLHLASLLRQWVL